ncbi:MAG TPA: hypothetical protein VJA25_02460 [Dehalococcoidia bacterium]|nr:hypothetical protein [Dehalococcoidia bacterium]
MRATELADLANDSCGGGETGTRWQREAIMGFPKVFKRKVETHQQPAQRLKDPCRHLALAARWSKVHEVGAEQRPTAFRCTDCGEEFSIEDAHEAGRRHLVTW